MVEMSDFMAYLDTVVSGLDSHVFKLNKERVVDKKIFLHQKKILFMN